MMLAAPAGAATVVARQSGTSRGGDLIQLPAFDRIGRFYATITTDRVGYGEFGRQVYFSEIEYCYTSPERTASNFCSGNQYAIPFTVRGDGQEFSGAWEVNEATTEMRSDFASPFGSIVSTIETDLGGTFDFFPFDTAGAGPFAYEYVAYAVPEPATWAMMIAGIGLTGGALRRRARYRSVTA